MRAELVDRYGPLPAPVEALLEVATFRNLARAAGLTDVTAQGKFIRFAPVELPESASLRLRRLYPGVVLKPAVRTVLVPSRRRRGSADARWRAPSCWPG